MSFKFVWTLYAFRTVHEPDVWLIICAAIGLQPHDASNVSLPGLIVLRPALKGDMCKVTWIILALKQRIPVLRGMFLVMLPQNYDFLMPYRTLFVAITALY